MVHHVGSCIGDLSNLFVAPAPTGIQGADDANITEFLAALPPGAFAIFPKTGYVTGGGLVFGQQIGQTFLGPGMGRAFYNSALFTLANNANPSTGDVIHIIGGNIRLSNMGINGNWNHQVTVIHGVQTDAGTTATYPVLDHLFVEGCSGSGIVLNAPLPLSGMMNTIHVKGNQLHGVDFECSDFSWTDGIVAQSATGDGVKIGSASDISMSNIHSWGNAVYGFEFSAQSGTSRLQNSYSESNNIGIYLRGVTNRAAHIVDACYIWKNTSRGIYSFSGDHLTVSNNIIIDNNQSRAAGASGAGIVFDTVTASKVVNNTMMDDQGTKSQTYGYAENLNTCVGCLFVGNVSRAADHSTGNWLIGAGGTPTVPASPALYNVG